MAVTGLPVGRLSLRSQGNLLTLTLGLLKLAQLLVVGSEKALSNEQTLAKAKPASVMVKPASVMGAEIQRVHGRHLGAVLRAVSQLVKLLVKPSPALALG